MKFSINKETILNLLHKIQGLTGRKTDIFITSHILIKATGKSISVFATDLETGFKGIYPASVEKEGSIVINSKKIFDIIKNFPSDDILIHEVENCWIEIGKDNIEYHIVGLSPNDFPDFPEFGDTDFFEIDSISFKKMIDKTIFISGDPNDKRTHIHGIYFDPIYSKDKNIIRFVSTDGKRLSMVDYFYENNFKFSDSGALIPKKGLYETNKFLKSEGSVNIGFKKNYFIIKNVNETIVIRLLEGDFPKYNELFITDDNISKIHIDRQMFFMMLKRMSILSTENYKGILFNFKENNLVITATNPEVGDSKENMVIKFQNKPIKIAFNPKYFIEAISVIDDDNIILNIKDEEHPCIIEGETDKNFLSIIMPMRI